MNTKTSRGKYLHGVDIARVDAIDATFPPESIERAKSLWWHPWVIVAITIVCIAADVIAAVVMWRRIHAELLELGSKARFGYRFDQWAQWVGWVFFLSIVALTAAWLLSELANWLLTRQSKKLVRPAPASAVATRSFGHAGAVAAAAATFGGRAEVGAKGEERTKELIDHLQERVPGLIAFHGLRFPGSKKADIDHVLLYGDRVIVVDSKLFGAGDYVLDGEAITCQQRGTSWPTPMPSALANYAQQMGPTAKLSGVIVVHGSKTTATGRTGALAMMGPEEFMTWVLRTLAEAGRKRETAPKPHQIAVSYLAGSLLPIPAPESATQAQAPDAHDEESEPEPDPKARFDGLMPPEPDFTRDF